MPTILDALVIELGLDPKKLTQGQQQAIASFKKTQEDAKRIADTIEDAGRKIVDTLYHIRNQFVAFTAAALEATGVEEFFKRMTQSNLAIGNTARGLGLATEELSKWQIAVRLAGGDASDATQAVTELAEAAKSAFVNPERYAQFTAALRPLLAANPGLSFGKELADLQANKVGALTNFILKLSQAGAGRNIAQMTLFFKQMGLSSGFINLLTRSPEALRAFLAEAERIGPQTDKDWQAALRLNAAWVQLSTSLQRFGNTLVTEWGPKIAEWFDYLSDRAQALGNIILGMGIGAAIGTFTPLGPVGGAVVGGGFSAFLQWMKGNLGTTAALPLKRGATGGGDASDALVSLLRSIVASEPELKEITALNDLYHKGTSSKHAQGLAGDFTLQNPAHSAEVAQRLRQRLAGLGVDARVIDEYLNPSARSTGGHIHVQFNSAEAARRYAAMSGAGVAMSTGRTTNTNIESNVSIGNFNLSAPNATNTQGIVREFGPFLNAHQRRALALSANGGAN